MQQPQATAGLARAWPLLLFPVALDPVHEPCVLVHGCFASTRDPGRSDALALLRIQPRGSRSCLPAPSQGGCVPPSGGVGWGWLEPSAGPRAGSLCSEHRVRPWDPAVTVGHGGCSPLGAVAGDSRAPPASSSRSFPVPRGCRRLPGAFPWEAQSPSLLLLSRCPKAGPSEPNQPRAPGSSITAAPSFPQLLTLEGVMNLGRDQCSLLCSDLGFILTCGKHCSR